VRTLPLRLAQVDGESLPGYIARYVHTFQIQPGDVVRALGLDAGAGTTGAAARYGLSLSAEQLQHAAVTSGIATEVLERMLLSRYVGRAADQASTAPAVLGDAMREHKVWIWCSQFCPGCLREDGAWRLRWQLGCNMICVTHQVLLRLRCPQCARVPQVSSHRRWPQDHHGVLTDPTRCWRRRGLALCRADLATADAVSVAGETRLIGSERQIDALLDGHYPSHRRAGSNYPPDGKVA
jgi:hypothetical protein